MCICGWTWTHERTERETTKGQRTGTRLVTGCLHLGWFANEKPLCPHWRLTLWFRQAGSVSCLPCTFSPLRSTLCQASAEQTSPCDWDTGGVVGVTKGDARSKRQKWRKKISLTKKKQKQVWKCNSAVEAQVHFKTGAEKWTAVTRSHTNTFRKEKKKISRTHS